MSTKATRWTPFRQTTDRCVWTGEDCPDVDTVILGCDVFAQWEGAIYNKDGNAMRLREGMGMPLGDRVLEENHYTRRLGAESFPLLKLCDVRQSIFATIDARPNQRFILPTRNLERVRKCWQMTPPSSYNNEGDRPPFPSHRPNLTLAAVVDCPADLKQLPKLAELRSLVGGLGVIYSGQRKEIIWLHEFLEDLDMLVLAAADDTLEVAGRLERALSAAEAAGVEVLELERTVNDASNA